MATRKEDDPIKELADSFARWEAVYRLGCSDPFYPDGTNLNLIRNHILYYKKQIEDQCPRNQYSDIYYQETPPEVPNDFMARTEEIRNAARKSLQIYKADPNYNYLLQRIDLLRREVIDRHSVGNVLGYVRGLEIAIEKDDLVSMKRHRTPKGYLEAFAQCAKKIRELEPPKGQLSIFDAIAAAQDELLRKKQNAKQKVPEQIAR